MNTSSTQQQRARGIRLTVAVIIAVVSVLVGGFFYAFTKARVMSIEELKSEGAYLYNNPRLLPNFSLLNDRGEEITAASFEGKWNLVFFGFTYCPDVCPTTLALLKAFYLELDPAVQKDTQIWLASVDPARDTPEQLHSYLEFFHPEFRGITGEFLDVHRFATALNIPFAKVPGGGSDYLVEHSANIAIINPEGHSLGFFKAPLEIAKLKRSYLSVHAYY